MEGPPSHGKSLISQCLNKGFIAKLNNGLFKVLLCIRLFGKMEGNLK